MEERACLVFKVPEGWSGKVKVRRQITEQQLRAHTLSVGGGEIRPEKLRGF